MATQTLTTQNIFAQKQAAPAKVVPQERIRAYKEFLTPALHRRFTSAAAIAFFFCWAEVVLGSNSGGLLWSWFPLGPAGVKALLLFIPCLAVFIVRVANMHIGERAYSSTAEGIYTQLVGIRSITSTLHTLAWYIFSAWFFGEAYIWTRNESAELAMVDPGRAYERPRLNENPIYLRCLFVFAGVVQAGIHLVKDYDRVKIPLSKDDEKHVDNVITRTLGPNLERIPQPARIVIERFGEIGFAAVNLMLVANIGNLILYFALVRKLVWPWTYSTARLLFSQLPEKAAPTGIMHLSQIMWQSVAGPFALIFLWEVCNTAFSASVAQAPLKKGAPLTNEIKDATGRILHKSKDPNGSLLTGLKSKKETGKSFAFWELFIICEQFEQRRKTIYTEVDRRDGPTWNQVCDLALQEIQAVKQRIDEANKPVDYKSKQSEIAAQQQSHKDLIAYQPEEAGGLKRIADQSVKDSADVFAKQKPDLINSIGNMARSIGQAPGQQDPVSPQAYKALQWGVDQMLSPEGQQRLSPAHFQAEANGYVAAFLKTPAGEPFRQTFALKTKTIIFGTPTSSRSTITHAIKALTILCTHSLKEDDFGLVQKDIARIVRTLSSTIQTITSFLPTTSPHSSDVFFQETDRSNIPEIEDLLYVLRHGLKEIMLAFGEYANTLGLSKKEVREAGEASKDRRIAPPSQSRLGEGQAGGRPEMAEMPNLPRPAEARQRRVYN